jgi:hypothetical protein
MFKVIVKKNGVQSHSGEFKTIEDANKWVEYHKSNSTFGKDQRWVNENKLTEAEKQSAIDSAFMDNPFPSASEPSKIKMYLMPRDFEVVGPVDISADNLENKLLQESVEAFNLALLIKAKIRVINLKKLKSGIWNDAKWNQFKNDSTIALANKALDQASLNDFKTIIQSVSEEFYSQNEKANITNMIDGHNLKWG